MTGPDETKTPQSIIDSLDDLQQQLNRDRPSPACVEQAKRTLLADQRFPVFPIPNYTPTPTGAPSQDRRLLQQLVAEADQVVAMLLANN